MNPIEQLQPWCLICLQPNLQHLILNRFQRRHEAEAHLKVLRQIAPSASYMVMFDQIEEMESV
jgi:hypothetical protein